LANADAHGAKGITGLGAVQLRDGCGDETSAAGAERMADGDSATIGIDAGVIVGEAEIASDSERLCGKGFVELDDADIGKRNAGTGEKLLCGGSGSETHDAGRDAYRGGSDNACAGREFVFCDGFLRGEEDGASTVVDSGSVSGGDGAGGLDDGLEIRESFESCVGTGMLVRVEHFRGPVFLQERDGNDFLGEKTIGVRAGPALLGAERKGVLIGAGNAELFGDVFGGFGHRVRAVAGFHFGVDEAPADGGIENFGSAAERSVRLGHDERRARHALDATRDDERGFAGFDGASGEGDGFEARTAKTIDGDAGDFLGKPGKEESHAGDVAIVFTGLVGTAVDDVVENGPIDGRIALSESAQRDGGEIVGSDGGESAGVAAEGGSYCVANKGFGQEILLCRALRIRHRRILRVKRRR